MTTRLISSSSETDRALKFAEPIVASIPSTVTTLACSIDGWNDAIRMPCSSRLAYVDSAATWTNRLSA